MFDTHKGVIISKISYNVTWVQTRSPGVQHRILRVEVIRRKCVGGEQKDYITTAFLFTPIRRRDSGIYHFTSIASHFAIPVQILSAMSTAQIQLGARFKEVAGIGSAYESLTNVG